MQRLEKAGFNLTNGARTAMLAFAFRDFDGALKNGGLPVGWYGYFEGISKAQKRRAIIEIGLPAFWREQGFPPQCRAVGEDDFECK